jgi:hypothetical protein
VWVRKSVRKSKKEYCRIELWLCNHINPYLGDVLPYMVVPLITYLVSPLLRAVSKKNNPWSFFAIPTPPWAPQNIPSAHRTWLSDVLPSKGKNTQYQA